MHEILEKVDELVAHQQAKQNKLTKQQVSDRDHLKRQKFVAWLYNNKQNDSTEIEQLFKLINQEPDLTPHIRR